MSHFTVLVIGDDYEAQLQPFHEFECTGFDDEYVQNVDRLAEARELYAQAMAERYGEEPADVEVALRCGDISPEQHLYWSAEPDKRQTTPDFQTWLRQWDEAENYGELAHEENPLGPDEEPSDDHKYGWVRMDKDGNIIEWVRRTNPNAKWDWYQVGGRWRGYFKVKEGVAAEVGAPRCIPE